VLLVDFHGDYQIVWSSCVLLVDRSIVMETVTDDLSYQWHGSSCVLLVDCRVVSGLLDEDIMERYLPS
jgi:hypothetical protein